MFANARIWCQRPQSSGYRWHNHRGVARLGIGRPLYRGKAFSSLGRLSTIAGKGGESNHGCYGKVAEDDFDGDDIPEIVVAVGDRMLDIVLNDVTCYAPQSPNKAVRR